MNWNVPCTSDVQRILPKDDGARAGRRTVGLPPAKGDILSQGGGVNRCMRCIQDMTPSNNCGVETLDPPAAKVRSKCKPTDVSDPLRRTVAASSSFVLLNPRAAFCQTRPWYRLSNKKVGSPRAILILLGRAYGQAERFKRSRWLQAPLHRSLACRMTGRLTTPSVRPQESLGVLLHVRSHHLLPHVQHHIIS